MTRDAAAVVRDAVVQAIDPLEIVLFGSVAERASGRDIDLLVVTDDDDRPTNRDRRDAPACRAAAASAEIRHR